MTMDVSRLGIVVESSGIKEARQALDGGNGRGGLVGAAEKAEKSITKLTDSIERMSKTNVGGFASAWNQALGGLSGTIAGLNSAVASATATEPTPAAAGQPAETLAAPEEPVTQPTPTPVQRESDASRPVGDPTGTQIGRAHV